LNEIFEIEDVIPVAFQNTIEKILMGKSFPFYLNTETVNYVSDGDNSDLYWDKNTQDAPQFVHVVIQDESQKSEYWSVLRPLLYFIISKANIEFSVDRCKVNLNHANSKFANNHHYPPHKDPAAPGSIAAIYYVNDCDGDTLLFKEPKDNRIDGEYEIIKRVSPKKGKVLLFPANTVHCGTPPQTSEVRCVVNFVLKVDQ
jgi:hypothetical protein